MISCIIVDDDAVSRTLLKKLIGNTGRLNLIGVYESAEDAFDGLADNKVDLLFLDIEMPEMNGLELIRSIESDPYVILTTVHEEYAFDAYQLDVDDYLLKPIEKPEFLKAVNKISKKLEADKSKKDNGSTDHIFIKKKGAHTRVDVKNILWLESEADYVNIITSNEDYMVNSTMNKMLERLPADEFKRVHRSYIVRLDKIESLKDNMIEIGEQIIPVSKTYKEDLKNSLNIF